MKIRAGFVSNSSTSSFCIFGCCIEETEAINLLVASGVLTEEDKEDTYDALEKVAGEHNLEFSMPGDYCDYAYFGFDFPSIPNDVNVGEWKAEKEKKLKELFGDNIDCVVHMEAWENR